MSGVKKNVFSAVLKLSKDGELRTEHGHRFHAAGPATTNARMPNFVLVRWTTRSPRADDRVRPSTQELAQSLDKYAGASPCIALYIIRHSLNWMRCASGSQCSRSRIKPVTLINDDWLLTYLRSLCALCSRTLSCETRQFRQLQNEAKQLRLLEPNNTNPNALRD